MTSEAATTLKAGVVGLGMAGNMILPSLARIPGVEMTAAVDLREHALGAFREQYGGRTFGSLERLCADPDVEAVWVATPTHLHCEHAIALANAGKHVIVEKPMAVTLDECRRMIEAAERNNVVLIAGGARSFDPAFVEMRRLIREQRLGRLGALATWAFTTWMTRAREPHEVDVQRGGGALYNQAAHPIDVLRLLGGGMLRSIRGNLVDLGLRGRDCAGYFCAYLEFEDGTPATLMYNGYGFMQGWELLPWGETPQRMAAADGSHSYRRALRAGTADEYEARELLRFGGRPRGEGGWGAGDGNWTPQDAGIVLATCELGEIRQSAKGLYVYDDEGRHDEPLEVASGNNRLNEVAELRDAIAGRKAPLHSGRWGMATMEALLALMQSAQERREIRLEHQVPVSDL